MKMISDAVDKRAVQDQVFFWFDSGGSLALFRLSVCRLMVAIFTGCILHLSSRTVH